MKAAKDNYFVRFAALAYQLCQRALPLYWHPKSPHRYTVPQLVACLLLMRRLRLSYRDVEQLLWAMDQVRAVLGLSTVPDHTTLQRAFARLKACTWHLLIRFTADLLAGGGELCVAADSTGFVCTQASLYYQTRSGRLYTAWRKGVYVVGCGSQAVLGAVSARGPGSDASHVHTLRARGRRYALVSESGCRVQVFIGDAGFDGRSVREGDLVAVVARGGRVVGEARLGRQALVESARLEGVYGQRWKVETVHSVMKRKFGEEIISRRGVLQCREVLLLAVVYNLHRLWCCFVWQARVM